MKSQEVIVLLFILGKQFWFKKVKNKMKKFFFACIGGAACSYNEKGQGGLQISGLDRSDWSYEGPTGPENWAEEYENCGGKSQSPINIRLLEAIRLNKNKGF